MKKYKISLLLAMLVSVICFTTVPVSAASTLSKSTTKKQLFAVPEGGWSSIRVNVEYYDIYTVSGTKNKFSSRKKSVVYKRAAATSMPAVKVHNVKHSNGKVFSSWTKGQIMFDPNNWDGGSIYTNSTAVTYANTTKVTGNLPFTLSCSGGVPASSAGSVSMALKTK